MSSHASPRILTRAWRRSAESRVDSDAYLTAVVAGAFYVVASGRLLALSARTRKQPELWLSFGLGGLYYLAYHLPNLLGASAWPQPVALAIEWLFAICVIPYLMFIRSAFRPRQAWARGVVALCSSGILVSTAMRTMRPGWVEFTLDDPWFFVAWGSYTAPTVWLIWEAALCRRSALKRARLGLCPPLVANRYLLLAAFGSFQVLACFADLSWAYDNSSMQAVSMLTDTLVGGTEIASVAVLWLAFFPPVFYSRWLERNAALDSTPLGG